MFRLHMKADEDSYSTQLMLRSWLLAPCTWRNYDISMAPNDEHDDRREVTGQKVDPLRAVAEGMHCSIDINGIVEI